MSYKRYVVTPLAHALGLSAPSLNQPHTYASWGAKNFRIEQMSPQKRWGYEEYRDLGAGVDVQQIVYYRDASLATSTIVLTDTDAIKLETAASKTWSYINIEHTTPGTAQVNADPSAQIDGTTTDWVDATDLTAPEVGDKFILDANWTDDEEPDASWREILTIDSDTQITLTDTWGHDQVAAAAFTILKKYEVPTNERWTWCIVQDASNNNLLIFTNGGDYVQSWNGAGRATNLDTTNAVKARYCLEFADRLVLADMYLSGSRRAYTVKCSKSGDPTDWTDSTAAEYDLIETEDVIMGLGRVGNSLVVYKEDSLIFGHRTGISTDPLAFPTQRRGIGTPAPYSIVQAMGTNLFLGREDFYMINGDMPSPIGEPVRAKFFNIVNTEEIKRVYGYHVAPLAEVRWLATADDGTRWEFVYNYRYQEWTVNERGNTMSCGGKGGI